MAGRIEQAQNVMLDYAPVQKFQSFREQKQRKSREWLDPRRSDASNASKGVITGSLILFIALVLFFAGRAIDEGLLMALAAIGTVILIMLRKVMWVPWALVVMAATGFLGVLTNNSHMGAGFLATAFVAGAIVANWTDVWARIGTTAAVLFTWFFLFGLSFDFDAFGLGPIFLFGLGLMMVLIIVLSLLSWGWDLWYASIAVAVFLGNWLVFSDSGAGLRVWGDEVGGYGTFDSGYVFHLDWLFNSAILLLLAASTLLSRKYLEQQVPSIREELHKLLYEGDPGDTVPGDKQSRVHRKDWTGFIQERLEQLELSEEELTEAGVTPLTYNEYAAKRAVYEIRESGLQRRNGTVTKKVLDALGFRKDFLTSHSITPEEIRTGVVQTT